MKKLRLHMDDLQVDSFETALPDAGEGTVEGHATVRCTGNYPTCRVVAETCVEGNTCDENCPGITWIDSCPCYPETAYNPSCEYTCNETCQAFPCTM